MRHRAFLILLAASALAPPSRGQPPRPNLAAEGNTVQARDGDQVLWTNVHDRAGQFHEPSRPGHLVGPVYSGPDAYYAVGVSLYRIDPQTGVVRQRVLLPGPASALEPAEPGVAVEVRPAGAEARWSRRYRVGPTQHEVPFFLPGALQMARLARLDAERAPAEELAELAARDPTNPWYRYWHGRRLREAGQEEAALAAFRSTLEGDRAYDFELLPMALLLDEAAPELGQRAFERALGFLLAQGYEPELMHTLIGLLIHYGPQGPAEAGKPAPELERLNRLGARLWDLAPLVEAACWFYKGLAEANGKAGRPEEAARWEARAQQALPYRVFGMASRSGERAGAALNLLAACALALVLGIAVKLVRDFGPLLRQSGWRRLVPFSTWSRAEVLGFLLVVPVLGSAAWTAVRGIGSIALVAAMPLDAAMGNPGHPAGVDYWSRVQGTASGDFVYALALHKSGDTQAAAQIYERLDLPQARANLKLIREGASADPQREERARRYGWSGPALALPTPEIWDEALGGRWRLGNPAELLQGLLSLGTMADEPLGLAALLKLEGLGLIALGLAVLGALAALVAPRRGAGPESLAGRALTLVVPGTARGLGLIGPLLLAACLFSGFVAHALSVSGGTATNVLEAIAVPNITRAYGIAAPLMPELEAWVRKASHLWWAILGANAVFVLVAEALRARAKRG